MLSPYRVLDLTDERGFLAGKIFGDLGADVIKLEPPGGDPVRQRGPFLRGEPGPERSLTWLALNTSKRGITLDLESARGRELFVRLVLHCDVVLESFAPGLQSARGIGYAELRKEKPDLVYCAITPFGQTGPHAHYLGHDLVVVAMGGNASMTGDPDRPPVRCSMPTAYYHAAPEAALGVLMALWVREEGGEGDFVDVSLQETQLATLITGAGQYAHTGRLGQRTGGRMGRTREIWRAKDGWVSFGLRGGAARIPNLVATVEYMQASGAAPAWLVAYDWSRFNHNALSDEEIAHFEEAFGAFFRSKTMRELYEEALRRRILLAPCNDAREILEHPQLRDRELFTTVDYPELGASIEHPAFFARASRSNVAVRRRAPMLGEHNAEVFEELGVDEEEREALAQEGVT